MMKILKAGATAVVTMLALSAPAEAQITQGTCSVGEATFYLNGASLGSAIRCAGWVEGANDSNNQPMVFEQMELWGFANPFQVAKVEDPDDAVGDAAGWGNSSGGPISLGATYTNFVLALKAANNFSLYEFTGIADGFAWNIQADIQGGGLSHFTIYDGTTTTVPEPGSLLLLGTGLLGMAAVRRRREDLA